MKKKSAVFGGSNYVQAMSPKSDENLEGSTILWTMVGIDSMQQAEENNIRVAHIASNHLAFCPFRVHDIPEITSKVHPYIRI